MPLYRLALGVNTIQPVTIYCNSLAFYSTNFSFSRSTKLCNKNRLCTFRKHGIRSGYCASVCGNHPRHGFIHYNAPSFKHLCHCDITIPRYSTEVSSLWLSVTGNSMHEIKRHVFSGCCDALRGATTCICSRDCSQMLGSMHHEHQIRIRMLPFTRNCLEERISGISCAGAAFVPQVHLDLAPSGSVMLFLHSLLSGLLGRANEDNRTLISFKGEILRTADLTFRHLLKAHGGPTRAYICSLVHILSKRSCALKGFFSRGKTLKSIHAKLHVNTIDLRRNGSHYRGIAATDIDEQVVVLVDGEKSVVNQEVDIPSCMTPLHFAAITGDLAGIEENIKLAGQRTSAGYTALHLAICHRQLDAVRYLLTYEGHIATNMRQTPKEMLEAYLIKCPEDEAKIILEDLTWPSVEGRTATDIFHPETLSHNALALTQYLLDQAPTVFEDAQKNSGYPSLSSAVETFLSNMGGEKDLYNAIVVIASLGNASNPEDDALKCLETLLFYTHDENYVLNDLRSILVRLIAEHHWTEVLAQGYSQEYCDALRGLVPRSSVVQDPEQTEKDGWTPWFRYIEQGNISAVRMLSKDCAKTHLQVFVSAMGYGPWFLTGLMMSVITRDTEVFDTLVDVEVCMQDKCLGYTALMVSILMDWEHAVEALALPKILRQCVEKGRYETHLRRGEKKLQGIMGKTALACAVEANRIKYVDILIDEAGLTNGMGTPAIVYAMDISKLDLFKRLLPLERNCKDAVGNDLLYYAEKAKHNIFKHLLLNDARFSA